MSRTKTLVFSLVPLIVFLTVLETTARVIEIWIPPTAVDLGLGFEADSRVFVEDPDEPGVLVTDPAKASWFRMQRFVLPKPDSVFRVAILGGSNVYRLHDRLPELANRLRGRSADERRVRSVRIRRRPEASSEAPAEGEVVGE